MGKQIFEMSKKAMAEHLKELQKPKPAAGPKPQPGQKGTEANKE